MMGCLFGSFYASDDDIKVKGGSGDSQLVPPSLAAERSHKVKVGLLGPSRETRLVVLLRYSPWSMGFGFVRDENCSRSCLTMLISVTSKI
jgi:hypothetical protein